MIVEISLVTLVITQLVLVVSLFVVFFKIRNSVKTLHRQVEKTTTEAHHLLSSLEDFVQGDLRSVSAETSQFLNQASAFVSDLNTKSKSVALTSAVSNFFSDAQSEEKKSPVTEAIKWGSRGWAIYKLTRRLMKKYGK